MQISDIVNRFLFYARDNKDLLHVIGDKQNNAFMVCDMEDVGASVKNGIKFPCMLLQVPLYEKEGEIDATIEHVECSFIILNKVKLGDFAGRIQAYSDCKAIADQMIYHMIQDADTYFDGAMPKTSEGPVGPVVDSIYGWGVNFTFEQGIGTTLNDAKWGGTL